MSVIILTTQELSVNRIDLQAPTLKGPPRTNLVAGTPSCTTPRQQTMYYYLAFSAPNRISYYFVFNLIKIGKGERHKK